MGGAARFWRNVAIIAGAHVLALIAFVRWGSASRSAPQQQVVWLSGANLATSSSASTSRSNSEPAAQPTPEPYDTAEAEEQPTVAAAKSEIQLPIPSPTPSTTPRIVKTPPPAPKPQSAARSTPKPARKKSQVAKATPKPKPKTTAEDDETNVEAARDATANTVGAGSAGMSGTSRGGAAKSEVQWYGRMLHDRFHSAWDQPTSVVASGAKISALVKARIEENGRVSRFEIVKPSGNIVVDESVRAVASKVTQVDPLPNGIGNGDHYDVTINFELNPEE